MKPLGLGQQPCRWRMCELYQARHLNSASRLLVVWWIYQARWGNWQTHLLQDMDGREGKISALWRQQDVTRRPPNFCLFLPDPFHSQQQFRPCSVHSMSSVAVGEFLSPPTSALPSAKCGGEQLLICHKEYFNVKMCLAQCLVCNKHLIHVAVKKKIFSTFLDPLPKQIDIQIAFR